MKQIDRNNKIFESKDFQKDKCKFYISLKILQDKNAKIYSNENDYVIMQMQENMPIWIWTKDNIDRKYIKEIMATLNLHFNKHSKITCKKEFYDLLLNEKVNIDLTSYFEMGTLYCPKTVLPKSIKGTMELATFSDLEILAKYWYDDYVEMEDSNFTLNQAKKDMESFINEGNFYILKNENGKIVCIARYTCIDNVADLNKVYTPVEERKKGYCANLIYNLSKMLLDKGITPMLYTDYNYIPSNKAYMNVGFIKSGTLISFYLKEVKNG